MKKIKYTAVIVLLVLLSGCSALKTLDNITNLQFKIDSISDFEVQDIKLGDKNQLGDFSPTEILRLIPAFTSGSLATSFNLNLLVKNPNATDNSTNSLKLDIVSFPWELHFNNKKIIGGNIAEPISLTGIGKEEKLALRIDLNLFDLLSGNSLNELLSTTLQVGGKNSSTKNISIYAKPVIGTIIGNISYPEQIKIVDYEYR